MRNVMMVVPVLMINCQVSEYLKIGPVTSQTNIVHTAIIKAAELPVALVAQLEKRSNKFFLSLAISFKLLCVNEKKAPMFYQRRFVLNNGKLLYFIRRVD